jgi:quinol monooxygenase YgiN
MPGRPEEAAMALQYGLLALVEARSGKEQEVWNFLQSSRATAAGEAGTRTWYAFRAGGNIFGIFDTFETEEARQAHLDGAIPAALAEHGAELLAKAPDIQLIELIAVK